MKNSIYGIIIIGLITTQSCIDAFDYDFDGDPARKINITGFVSNVNGPYEIRVHQSVHFDNADKSPEPIHGAMVLVEDKKGNQYQFQEVYNSIRLSEVRHGEDQFQAFYYEFDTVVVGFPYNYRYISPDRFKGEIGTAYRLIVEVPENFGGKRYISDFQTLADPVEIAQASFTFERSTRINSLGNESEQYQWNITVETDVIPEDTYLTWRTKGTFEIQAFPEDFCIYNDCSHSDVVPPSCCKYCWVEEFGTTLPTSGPKDVNGNKIIKSLAPITIDNKKVYKYYHLDIYQLAINEEAHEFFSRLNQQITAQGSIFDAPPGPISGNMYNPEDPEEEVLGLFFTAGVSQTTLKMSRKDVDVNFTPYYFPNDCRLIKNATSNRPSYYQSTISNQCYNYILQVWHPCDRCYDFDTETWFACNN